MKLIFQILILLSLFSSCGIEVKDNVHGPQTQTTSEIQIITKNAETVQKDSIVNLIMTSSINDTVTVAITKEYIVPRNKILEYDSSFYQSGTFVNLFISQKQSIIADSLRSAIQKGQIDYRINLGKEGIPTDIETWDFQEKTNYNWFLAIDMIVASDFIETSLIGFDKNGAKLIAQEISLDLGSAELEDSNLTFLQDYSEPTENGVYRLVDSIRINIYNLEKNEFKIKDEIENLE